MIWAAVLSWIPWPWLQDGPRRSCSILLPAVDCFSGLLHHLAILPPGRRLRHDVVPMCTRSGSAPISRRPPRTRRRTVFWPRTWAARSQLSSQVLSKAAGGGGGKPGIGAASRRLWQRAALPSQPCKVWHHACKHVPAYAIMCGWVRGWWVGDSQKPLEAS